MNKVILISIDGMRPDGLKQCKSPYLDELLEKSSYTFNARTVGGRKGRNVRIFLLFVTNIQLLSVF